MYFTIDPAFFATMMAFIAIKLALETIRNADLFTIFLLLLPVAQATYKYAVKAAQSFPGSSTSTSSSSSSPPLPTRHADPDSPSTTAYLALLQDLAPAFAAIESCFVQLYDNAELREELASESRRNAGANRAMLTMLCGRLGDQIVETFKELHELEEVVSRGLTMTETSIAGWTDRADGIDAAIARQQQDATAMWAGLASNDLKLSEVTEALSADMTSLRDQLTETATAVSLATLEQRMASFEADQTLRLEALRNVTDTMKARDYKLQGEVRVVKAQLSSVQELQRKAVDECKITFDKALRVQSRTLGERCDKMEQETTRLRDEAIGLQNKLRESEASYKRALDDQKVTFEQALVKQSDAFAEKLALARKEDSHTCLLENKVLGSLIAEEVDNELARIRADYKVQLDQSAIQTTALLETQSRHEETLRKLQAASGEDHGTDSDDDDDGQHEDQGGVVTEATNMPVATKKKNRRKKRVAKGGAKSITDGTAATSASSTITGEQAAEDADSTQNTHDGQFDATTAHIEPAEETATTSYTTTGEQHAEYADSTQMASDSRSDTETLLTDHDLTAMATTAHPQESSSSPAPHETEVVDSSSHLALLSSGPLQSHDEFGHTSGAESVTDEDASVLDEPDASDDLNMPLQGPLGPGWNVTAALDFIAQIPVDLPGTSSTAAEQGSSSVAPQSQAALTAQPEAQGEDVGDSTEKKGKKKNRRKMKQKGKK